MCCGPCRRIESCWFCVDLKGLPESEGFFAARAGNPARADFSWGRSFGRSSGGIWIAWFFAGVAAMVRFSAFLMLDGGRLGSVLLVAVQHAAAIGVSNARASGD